MTQYVFWGAVLELIIAAVIVPYLLFRPAPYGRYASTTKIPTVSSKLGWMLMESPSSIAFLIAFISTRSSNEGVGNVLAAMWLIHYVQRGFIDPFTMRTKGSGQPIHTVFAGLFFNILNGSINGLAAASDPRPIKLDTVFVAAIVLYGVGWWINRQSDYILRNLRKPGESGYKIPTGGAFRFVSAANYFGEIIEWSGYALLAWSLPAVAFVVFTLANLMPRAIAHHRWYTEKFPDYPKERRAVLPFIL